MTKISWNDKFLSGMSVEREEIFIHPKTDGLRLRATPNRGRTRLVWQYRRMNSGKLVIRTLGTFPEIGIAEARERATDANANILRGEAPFPEVVPVVTAMTVGQAWDRYAEDREERGTEFDYAVSIAKKDILPIIGGVALVAVTPDEIREVMRQPLLRRHGASGNVASANYTLKLCKRFFAWAVRNRLDGCVWSPAGAVDPLVQSVFVERHSLDVSEMALAILAAREFDRERGNTSWADIITLLCLLGNRKKEVMYMPVSEWDSANQIWLIQAMRYKTKRVCALPVGPWAARIFDRLAASAKGRNSRFMIPTQISVRNGNEHIVLADILNRMTRIAGELGRNKHCPRWTMHSTRYGVRSEIVNLGITDETMAERIIHPKAKPDMSRRYHKGFEPHMRDALTRWEQRLEEEIAAMSAARLKMAA